MAEAVIQNSSNTSVTSHFSRKPDETCTVLMKIEDIVDKMESSQEAEFVESEKLEHGNIKIRLWIYPNAKYNGQAGYIVGHAIIINPEKRKFGKAEVLIAESSAGVFLDIKQVSPEKLNVQQDKDFVVVKLILSHGIVLADKNAAYFPDGVFTVKFILSIRGEETARHTSSKIPQKSVTLAQITRKMAGDFKIMMENKRFSDFRIICQGEVIPCHRIVLSARSEIFGAMFEHNMKESETGEVEINDFDLATMKAVVLYMYTGEVEYSQGNAEQFMKAADKYGLEELKNAIEDTLVQDVKIENAIDMFVLGDAVNADKLRETSKDIIVRNAAAIIKIDGWKEALGRFQDLTFEIFESIANKVTA